MVCELHLNKVVMNNKQLPECGVWSPESQDREADLEDSGTCGFHTIHLLEGEVAD